MNESKSRRTQPGASGASAIARLGLAAIATMSLVSVFIPGRAKADHPPCLSQAAVTMEPSPETSHDGYQINDGRVLFKGTAAEEIVLRAPVFNTTGQRKVPWTHFSVLYRDPDGPGEIKASKSPEKREAGGTSTARAKSEPPDPSKAPTRTNQARVHAVLMYIDQSGSPPKKVVELDSNKATADDEASLKQTRHMRVKIPEGKLNFERNYYFVKITLTRKEIDEKLGNPEVLGFKLCNQFK